MGGYLILNRNGRPVEFHCTAPIRATRAQHILFGPTLEPYLYGEQLGRALTVRATIQPRLILTNKRGVLALRQMISTPIMLTEIPPKKEDKIAVVQTAADVSESEVPESTGSESTIPSTDSGGTLFDTVGDRPAESPDMNPDLEALSGKIEPEVNSSISVPEHSLLWNGVLLHPDKRNLSDSASAESFLREFEIDFDLAEPFDRITEAIYEAQKRAA